MIRDQFYNYYSAESSLFTVVGAVRRSKPVKAAADLIEISDCLDTSSSVHTLNIELKTPLFSTEIAISGNIHL